MGQSQGPDLQGQEAEQQPQRQERVHGGEVEIQFENKKRVWNKKNKKKGVHKKVVCPLLTRDLDLVISCVRVSPPNPVSSLTGKRWDLRNAAKFAWRAAGASSSDL